MEPLLQIGQLYTCKKVDVKKIKRYDLVVYLQGGVPYCHFLWQIDLDKKIFVTKSLKDPRLTDMTTSTDEILGIIENVQMGFLQKIKVFLINLFFA